MLDLLQKLINEHGSSSILKERLELVSDRYQMLEEKAEALAAERDRLKQENERLTQQVEQCQSELEGLHNSSAEKAADHNLEEEQIHVLRTLFEDNRPIPLERLAQSTRLKENMLEYHIDVLKDKELVALGPLIINQPVTYRLSSEGRKYVVENIET